MKLGKNYLKAFTLTALTFLTILSIFSTVPILTAGKFEPPSGWLSYNAVTFTDTSGTARVNEPVDVYFKPSTGNMSSVNEIRVIAPDNHTEVPYQTYNVSSSGGKVTTLNIVFQVSVPASGSAIYYVCYNKLGVSAPSYSTDLKLKTVPQGGVTEVTARVSNTKYSAYVGIEGSIGSSTTGSEVYIKDWTGHATTNIFGAAGGGIWSFPLVRLNTSQQYNIGSYNPAMTLVTNGSVFVEFNAPATFIGEAKTVGGLLNFTAKLRFYAHNSWFTNKYTVYTTGTKTYKFLKADTATDQVNMALAVYRNATGSLVYHNVNVGVGHPDTFSKAGEWDGKWVDYYNSTDGHGFSILQLPGGTPNYTGLMLAAFSSGHATSKGDTWDFYWNGSGTVFTANMVCGFHGSGNYTYAEDLYNQLSNSLQSTLEVLTENGSPPPTGEADRTGAGWSTYTPINVTETIGKARTFEPVDVFFKPSAGTCSDAGEIRVYDSAGNEIPSQVYNVTKPASSITSLNVVFEANVTASTEKTYYIWYNKPGASAPSYSTDLSFSTKVYASFPGYYTVNAANTYYNSTGDVTGTGAMSNVKVLGYSSTLNVMGNVFWPYLRLNGSEMPFGEGYFGFFPGANSTILRSGPVFADVLTNITNFGLAQGFRTSGVKWCTVRLRYYAYTPWVTANITYKANSTVYYEFMEIGVKVASTKATTSAASMTWLTRPNAAGTQQTYNMSKKPGNVTTDTKPHQNLTWCADWDQSWVCYLNKTTGNSPVGAALINLNSTTTTVFKGLKSETGDEGSPYWNNTCTTKTAKMAIAFFTNNNSTYAQTLYNQLSKHPLTWVIGPEKSGPAFYDRAVTNVDVYVKPSKSAYSSRVIRATQCYPTWTVAGVSYKVNVTVRNQGSLADTFTVTAYYGNTTGNYTLGTQTVTSLAVGASKNVTFTFAVPALKGYNGPGSGPNSAAYPYPTYTIYANASTTSDINKTNNVAKASLTIKVVWPGDISSTGNAGPDGHITTPDLFYFAKSWGKNANGPTYYPPTLGGYDYRADFNMDGIVDTSDLYHLGRNWGKGPRD